MSDARENELLQQQLRELEARVARLEAERDPAEDPVEAGSEDPAEDPVAPTPPSPAGDSPPASATEVAEAMASARQEPVPLSVTPPPSAASTSPGCGSDYFDWGCLDWGCLPPPAVLPPILLLRRRRGLKTL